MLHRHYVVLFGFERERIHEDIFADAITQHLLYADEISGDRRTNTFTLRVEHVEDHELVFDHVVVELQLASFVTG